jgi:hypothetical protein
MKDNRCGLCRRTANLRDSHLLPSALYKFMTEPTLQIRNPVIVTSGKALATSREVRQYFLCGDCEDRFSKNGENWTVSHCARTDGSFPLYESLKTIPPAIATSSCDAIFVSKDISEIKSEQIEYFASSVFWRAAGTKWRYYDQTIHLGPYEEVLRQYLLTEAAFISCIS